MRCVWNCSLKHSKHTSSSPRVTSSFYKSQISVLYNPQVKESSILTVELSRAQTLESFCLVHCKEPLGIAWYSRVQHSSLGSLRAEEGQLSHSNNSTKMWCSTFDFTASAYSLEIPWEHFDRCFLLGETYKTHTEHTVTLWRRKSGTVMSSVAASRNLNTVLLIFFRNKWKQSYSHFRICKVPLKEWKWFNSL